MKVEPVQQIQNINDYDIDKDEVYNTKTGETVADIEFHEILEEVLRRNKTCVK